MRITKIIALLALALALLAGCAQDAPDYPVLEALDSAGLALETAEDAALRASFPAEPWEADPDSATLMIYLEESIGTGSTANINVQYAGECPVDLDQEALDTIFGEMDKQNYMITVGLAEMRLLRGEPVIYAETVTQLTDAGLDLAIEAGALSEEMIEAAGGREALLSIPPTSQVGIYAVVDGHLYIYTGSYFTPEEKQLIIDTITVMIATTEKV